MVDTPGMRELQLWDSEEGFEATFADIATLAQQCRFHDCRHETEAGCAVREALQDGTLDAKRYANYKKTERELAHIARKERVSTRRQNKSSGKTSRKSDRDRKGTYQQLLYDDE